MSNNFEERVRQEFNERYPDQESMPGPTSDQWFSLAGLVWLLVGMFITAMVISGAPYFFGIALIVTPIVVPFTIIWGASSLYDTVRSTMSDALDEYLENEEYKNKEAKDVKKNP